VVTVPWYACASTAYLKRRGRPADVDALARHDLIGADAGFGRLSVFAWLRETFPAEAIVLRCSELNTMAALAQAGAGIALLPGDQARHGLDRLFQLDPRFAGSLWLLVHPDLRHTARVKALADFLFEHLRADSRLAPFIAQEAAALPAPGARKTRRR
jgi:DNA-binding transcriptional LysR family regulator